MRATASLTCTASAHRAVQDKLTPCTSSAQLIVGLVWFVETLGIVLLVGLIIMKSTVVRDPA